MKIVAERILIIILGLAALLSTYQGFNNAITFSQDFQWSPTKIFLEERNPYEVWLNGNLDEEIILSQAPNYLHQLYIILAPFGALEFEIAKLSWAAVNFLIAITITFSISNRLDLGIKNTLILLFIFICSTPLRNGLGNGQHAIFVLAFLSAPFLMRPTSIKLGLVCQGIGFSKYSFAPPFLIFNILQQGLRRSLLCLVFPLIGFIIFAIWTKTLPHTLILQPLLVAGSAVGSGSADIMSITEKYFGLGTATSGFCALMLSLALCLLVPKARSEKTRLPLICLISLATFKHLGYDFVFLLPVAAVILSMKLSLHTIFAALVVGWFWFGLKIMSTAAALLDISLSNFQPILILLNFCLLILCFFALLLSSSSSI